MTTSPNKKLDVTRTLFYGENIKLNYSQIFRLSLNIAWVFQPHRCPESGFSVMLAVLCQRKGQHFSQSTLTCLSFYRIIYNKASFVHLNELFLWCQGDGLRN